MKKLFTLFAAVVASLAMFATDPVVIDFTQNPKGLTEQEQGETITLTVNGVTITCTKGTETNATAPILSTDMLKWYKWATLEVSSTVGNIKTIEFTESSSNYGLDRVASCTVGTWENPLWKGDAASVTFGNNNQVRLNKIVVYFEDYNPTPVTIDTIGVSEAKARIDAGTLGKCYVYGRIVSVDLNYISQYHNVNCWMVDLTNANDTLEGYKMKGLENAQYNDATDVEYAEGDTVLFYASGLKKYNTTYEINEGYVAEVLGGSHQTATLDTLTVAEAMTLGNSLDNNAESEKVVVIGYMAKEKTAYSAQYGNQSIYLSDDPTATFGDFYAFQCAIEAPGASKGDKVAVTGKIMKYVGASGSATIEISKGSMEVIEHATGINEVEAEKAVKVIENGQLIIIRNGVKYNANGIAL